MNWANAWNFFVCLVVFGTLFFAVKQHGNWLDGAAACVVLVYLQAWRRGE